MSKAAELFEQSVDVLDKTFAEAAIHLGNEVHDLIEKHLDEAPSWEVKDPEGKTVFDEAGAKMVTTLPSGVTVGWDLCGCGNPMIVCGCEPIRLPRHVVALRALDHKYAEEALEASGRREAAKAAATTEPTTKKAPRGSQRSK